LAKDFDREQALDWLTTAIDNGRAKTVISTITGHKRRKNQRKIVRSPPNEIMILPNRADGLAI
jgi:hypothetical protein